MSEGVCQLLLKMVRHLQNPVYGEFWFFFLFLSSRKVIECRSTQDEGVPEGEEDMEPDPQLQPSGPKI